MEYGGTYEEQQKSFSELTRVLLLALVLVFGCAAGGVPQLRRAFRDPHFFGALHCGVVFALLVTRTTFNVASFMGLIMVIGIVAKNGILLLDAEARFAPRACLLRRRCCSAAGAGCVRS